MTNQSMMSKIYIGKNKPKLENRILLVHPVSPRNSDPSFFNIETPDFLLSSTHVDETFCPGAPLAVEGSRDARNSIPFVLEKVIWAESEGYDVIVINCMLDPALKEAKAAVSIPVLGLKESTTAIATLFGDNPGYIFPDGIDVANLGKNEEETFEKLAKAGHGKITNQGADVLIPNCAYLGGLADRLQSNLGVPVLANRDIGLKVAELVAIFNLKPELETISSTRSKSKIMLNKAYQMPFIGNVLYRLATLIKRSV